MSNIVGTVVSVSTNTIATKADKSGTYPAWQLIYKEAASGQVREFTKHINGLKFNKGLEEALNSLSPGDTFTAVVEKEGKFNEVKAIEKGGNVPVMAQGSVPSSGKVTGSNYETPAERATRQRLIVRQSSITAALAYLKDENLHELGLDTVLEYADRITDWVFETDKDQEIK